ncbi:hypothetical protein RWE87_05100 [Sinorhizobium meliloti]|uniref:hypothetical protein n=1 Tax=Rhizobium meliloti TaxID=382 RepID=UPI00299E557D|nr:hypothetical protein [Sinorhizobium meliloti]
MSESKHTPGPWGYVASTENHGPYVANEWGYGDICDCYTMSDPNSLSIRNGGHSKPIHFHNEEADANARLIAAAPDLLAALKSLGPILEEIHDKWDEGMRAGKLIVALRDPKLNYRDDITAIHAAIAKAEGRL